METLSMLRRSILAALLAGMLAMLSIGSAFAHECVISSRSDRGDQGAVNSKVWDTLTLEFVLTVFFGQDPDVVEAALDLREEFGLPESWVIRGDKTIGFGSSNPNLADGRGLDWLAGMVGPLIELLFAAAQEDVGEC
jgi:hypothetical protein